VKTASQITVIKASGQREPFSEKKVRRSIRRARIPKKLENEVVRHIYEIIYDGIPTHEIYQHISEFLGKSSISYIKGIYGLKQAIMQLGPSGFPFEKFVAKVLKHHGYETQVNVLVPGQCVEHEIDVVARKDNRQYMIECKFHNAPGARSDVKVALYIQARFEDIQKNQKNKEDKTKIFHQPWLITNTKFTTEAIEYGNCIGIKIIGWSHPESGDLQYLIESIGLHPVTCLSTLTNDQIKLLLNKGVVLLKQLASNQESLHELGLEREKEDQVLKEASLIVKGLKD
jgi:hypothetical protein